VAQGCARAGRLRRCRRRQLPGEEQQEGDQRSDARNDSIHLHHRLNERLA
jgi:hypothetical protein